METNLSLSQQANIIYFDNAATSYPKPESVIEAVTEYLINMGGNPGRSGHEKSIEAGEAVFSAREALAGLFGINNPMRVIFTCNATDALNLAIQGIARPGDHVITTSMEHNSTVRPLTELKKEGRIDLTIVQCSSSGIVDIDDLKRAVRPGTSLMVVNHASNVFGTLQPIGEIGKLCRELGVTLLADCAQSAGIIPLNMTDDNIDLLAYAGHKGLYGPTGTGGLVISDEFDYCRIRPLKFGGTGSRSDSIEQPEMLPDRFESGTLNAAGINGLFEGIIYINQVYGSVLDIAEHKSMLAEYFIHNAIEMVDDFITYIPVNSIRTGAVSFNIKGISPSDLTNILAGDYKIMCRQGLHCAPLAHKTVGTFPSGTVRFSFGIFNTKDEVDIAVNALREIGKRF